MAKKKIDAKLQAMLDDAEDLRKYIEDENEDVYDGLETVSILEGLWPIVKLFLEQNKKG
jgi:vacuolar-type H+-ATPase subunit D/Vma8